MSNSHVDLTEEWLRVRHRVTHDLLCRQLLPWCKRLGNALSGVVDDPLLDDSPTKEIAYLFAEAASGADWLVEKVDCMLPSKCLRGTVDKVAPDDKSDYLRFIDREWRSRLAIAKVCKRVATANRQARLQYQEVRKRCKTRESRPNSLQQPSEQLEAVRKFGEALKALDVSLRGLPDRI